jgi:hypothetical protein
MVQEEEIFSSPASALASSAKTFGCSPSTFGVGRGDIIGCSVTFAVPRNATAKTKFEKLKDRGKYDWGNVGAET